MYTGLLLWSQNAPPLEICTLMLSLKCISQTSLWFWYRVALLYRGCTYSILFVDVCIYSLHVYLICHLLYRTFNPIHPCSISCLVTQHHSTGQLSYTFIVSHLCWWAHLHVIQVYIRTCISLWHIPTCDNVQCDILSNLQLHPSTDQYEVSGMPTTVSLCYS